MNNVVRYQYGKKDKLKSRKEIDLLFKNGKKLQQFPLTVWYNVLDDAEELKAGVSAAKKSLRLATRRNKAKRLIREAYRLHKPELRAALDEKKLGLHVFVLYSSSEILSFQSIEEHMNKLIQKLIKKINEKN